MFVAIDNAEMVVYIACRDCASSGGYTRLGDGADGRTAEEELASMQEQGFKVSHCPHCGPAALKKFYIAVDCWGYPYGDAHEEQADALPDARACANLSPEASDVYACVITQVYAKTAELAVESLYERAVSRNS